MVFYLFPDEMLDPNAGPLSIRLPWPRVAHWSTTTPR